MRVASLVLALGVAVAPAARADGPVRAKDARGDVNEKSGLTHAERVSIDLYAVRVEVGSGSTTFEVSFRGVVRSPTFDQMFFVVMTPPAGSGETWQANAGTTTSGRGYAYYSPDDTSGDFVNCRARTTVDPARHRLVLEVKHRCLPSTEARVQVVSATGIFESDAPVSSRDTLRFPGTQLLSPIS